MQDDENITNDGAAMPADDEQTNTEQEVEAGMDAAAETDSSEANG